MPALPPSEEPQRSPLDAALDALVYAPLEALAQLTEDPSGFAARGRARADRQLAGAQVLGKFVLTAGERQLHRLGRGLAARVARELVGGLFPPRGASGPGAEADRGSDAAGGSEPAAGTGSSSGVADDRWLEPSGGPGGAEESEEPAPRTRRLRSVPGGNPGAASEPRASSARPAAPRRAPGATTRRPRPSASSPEILRFEHDAPGDGTGRPPEDSASGGAVTPSGVEGAPGGGGTTEPDGAGATALGGSGEQGLAIPDYDALAASQVVPRLAGLTREELEAVASYEATHRARRTILSRARQLLAEPDGS